MSNIEYPFQDLLALALLVPFLAFGVYGLRRRFLSHDEWGLALQSGVLLTVLCTVAFEIQAMREELSDTPVYYIFASLGILAAAMALYGHIAVSFLSRVIVDIFLPGGDHAVSQPRFGPAESLERLGDYQGALNEYYVLARVFPARPEIMARIGAALEALENHGEAAVWFGRAFEAQDRPPEALSLLWRLVDIRENTLNQPEPAARACEEFLQKFPDSPEAATVRIRLTRLRAAPLQSSPNPSTPSRSGLVRLEDEPIESRPEHH